MKLNGPESRKIGQAFLAVSKACMAIIIILTYFSFKRENNVTSGLESRRGLAVRR